MSTQVLSKQQAFLAMYSLLEGYWKLGGSSDIAALLGSLSLLPSGRTADPALAEDWDKAVENALLGLVDARMRLTRS
jgi:hypothetical protein